MHVMSEDVAVAWARKQAAELREMADKLGSDRERTYYAATARPLVGKAVEFLRRQAPGSEFAKRASAAVDVQQYAVSALREVAGHLDGWADLVGDGFAASEPFEARARVTAATDLMEQVQRLLDERTTHPAASVVLAGAALEEFLRSRLGPDAKVTGKPSLTSYAAALRKTGVLNGQDEKDVVAWAGQRNEAAHGHFDALNRDRAQIMVDGINLFMRQHAPAS
jgi:hypothetical protein